MPIGACDSYSTLRMHASGRVAFSIGPAGGENFLSDRAGRLEDRVSSRHVVLAMVVGLGIAGCGSGSGDVADPAIVMPNVVGLQLDVALSDIERAGINDEVEVLSDGTFGVLDESNWQVCEQLPAAEEKADVAPRLTVDRSCPNLTAESDSTETPPTTSDAEVIETAVTEPEPASTGPVDETYVYGGPTYGIVGIAEAAGNRNWYFVFTDALDRAGAYRDQVKLLVADIAHTEGTPRIAVFVYSDREVALSEFDGPAFEAEFGYDYAVNEVWPREYEESVAAYSGGWDSDAQVASDSPESFGISWYGAWSAAEDEDEIEIWKPE